MANIFDYTDYHLYLQKTYNEKKEKNPVFSYQVFARLIQGIPRAFLFNIINGKRKLPLLQCYRFSNALHHTKSEAEYFEYMVRYCDWAKNAEERAYFYEQMLKCKSGAHTPAFQLRKDQYEYLSKWYHSAVRALIELKPFNDDYAQLGKTLFPRITGTQARRSVQLLERLGLIVRGNDGRYRITENEIKVGDEISQKARDRFFFEYAELAKQSIMNAAPDSRKIFSLTLGVSKRTYDILCKESKEFKERIKKIVNDEKTNDRIYQYQIAFFPLTDNAGKG
jgi:uncharacterized protein (TIGR02147 family)